MTGVSLSYTLPVATQPTFQIWSDFVSGGYDATGRVSHNFDTLFGANHKFYGYLDMFTNFARDTQERGLVDVGARVTVTPMEHLRLSAALHYFQLFSPLLDEQGQERSNLGTELDLIASYTFLQGHATVMAGYSVIFPQEAFAAMGKGQDPEHWFFLQANMRF
jgi:hypothetical protein